MLNDHSRLSRKTPSGATRRSTTPPATFRRNPPPARRRPADWLLRKAARPFRPFLATHHAALSMASAPRPPRPANTWATARASIAKASSSLHCRTPVATAAATAAATAPVPATATATATLSRLRKSQRRPHIRIELRRLRPSSRGSALFQAWRPSAPLARARSVFAMTNTRYPRPRLCPIAMAPSAGAGWLPPPLPMWPTPMAGTLCHRRAFRRRSIISLSVPLPLQIKNQSLKLRE